MSENKADAGNICLEKYSMQSFKHTTVYLHYNVKIQKNN